MNKRFFPIFLLDLFNEYNDNEQSQNDFLPFAVAVNVMLKLTIISLFQQQEEGFHVAIYLRIFIFGPSFFVIPCMVVTDIQKGPFFLM